MRSWVWCKETQVFVRDGGKGSLTMSLAASFSGVWGGSVAAGLLDGMAESSSGKPSTDSEKWSKSKHGKGPQMHQVQLLSPSVTPWVIRCSVQPPPFSVEDRQTEGRSTHTHSRKRVSLH